MNSTDFGMTLAGTSDDGNTLYFAGSGIDQYVYVVHKKEKPEFMGGAFVTDSREELLKAAKILPHAKGPVKLEGPGGGEMVTAYDPE